MRSLPVLLLLAVSTINTVTASESAFCQAMAESPRVCTAERAKMGSYVGGSDRDEGLMLFEEMRNCEKAFVADLVSEENRGTAVGLFNFSVGLGALPASIIFGVLYSYFDKVIPGFGGTVAFGFGGTIALISMILLSVKIKEPSRGSN